MNEVILTGPDGIQRLEWHFPDGRVRVATRHSTRDSWSAPEWWQIESSTEGLAQ